MLKKEIEQNNQDIEDILGELLGSEKDLKEAIKEIFNDFLKKEPSKVQANIEQDGLFSSFLSEESIVDKRTIL